MLITVLSGVKGDTRRYRSFHLYEQFHLAGLECRLSHVTDPHLPDLLGQSGLVIFHRTALDPYVARLVRSVQDRGGVVLHDVDDLIFDPSAFGWIDSPDFQDPVRAGLYRDEMDRHRQALLACDGILASTGFLAEQAGSLGKPVRVHRNAFSLEMLSISQQAFDAVGPARRKIVIGYASGTPTHDRDFELVAPALREVMNRYRRVEVWLVGPLDAGPGWEHQPGRIQRIPLVPWRLLPFIQARFDINLAPLVGSNPFGQSKSEIKFMEAGLVQVPTVATPTDAFSFAIRSGENGFLANTPAEWLEHLNSLVEQPELRRSLGRKARQDVFERYHPLRRSAELLETLQQVYAGLGKESFTAAFPAGQPVEPGPIPPQVEAQPALRQMAAYTLRHRGVFTLLKQVWVYLRRMLAPVFPYRRRNL